MSDAIFLYLLGLCSSLMMNWLRRPSKNYWVGKRLHPAWFFITEAAIFLFVMIAAGGVFVEVAAYPSWTYIYWVTLGRGGAILAGLAAGFLITAIINSPAFGSAIDKPVSAAVVSLGPTLIILVLCLFAVPAMRQSFQLNGVKVAGLEVTLAPPAASSLGKQSSGYNMFGPVIQQSGQGNRNPDPRYSRKWSSAEMAINR
jgi:hypothetical protein